MLNSDHWADEMMETWRDESEYTGPTSMRGICRDGSTVRVASTALVSRHIHSENSVTFSNLYKDHDYTGLKNHNHVLHRKLIPVYIILLNTADQHSLQKELTHTILLHPSYFGPRMLQFLESKLYSDVEGTCSGQFGYIIAVVSILDIGKGMVLGGSGQAEFVTRYRAIVFKPFKGEVVDGVVNNVNKVRGLRSGCCYRCVNGGLTEGSVVLVVILRWVSSRTSDL